MPSHEFTMGHAGAIRFCQALLAQDPKAALQVYGEMPSWEDRSHCIQVATRIEGRPEFFDRWVHGWPDHPLPLLVRGAHGVRWGWEARSDASSEYVTQEMFDEFFRRLNIAEADLTRAVEVDPTDPVGWSSLITMARGLQIPQMEADHRMLSMMQRFPLIEGHFQYLQYKCQKWYGSHEEMFDYARSVTANTPDGSPLHVMFPMAGIEYNFAENPINFKKGLLEAGVFDEIVEAAHRSVLHPSFRPHSIDAAYALSVWALFFWKSFDEHLAKPIVDMLGDRMSSFPMSYYTSSRNSHADVYSKLAKNVQKRAAHAAKNADKETEKYRKKIQKKAA